MSSKSKSSPSETHGKPSPATPRVTKLNRGLAKPETESPSPVLKSRLSIDRSPRPAGAKPATDRPSPKTATPPDKPQSRLARGSDLPSQLNLVQEDLKKANERIILIDKEKAKALEELKEAHRQAEEASEKLKEALLAQKRAQEDSEIEKFRALELEQAGIEAVHKKEEEWHKELEAVRSRHDLDVSALLSTTEELQRLKQELTMTSDAKNQALTHADDATKIAEIQAEKADILSSELTRLKSLLDSKFEAQATENDKLVSKLKFEIESLKKELEIEKCSEEIIMEKDASIEQLNVELEAAKMAESYAHSIVNEWKNKVEDLERKSQEANKLERSASESLQSVMKQVEGSNDLLHNAEAEIDALKEKVGLLEMTVGRQKVDLQESERHHDLAKNETCKLEKMVESLKTELELVKEEKTQALNNEKLAASSVQTLLEEKNQLIDELENSKHEEEKSKMAMESLASALHEISAESREAKEKLSSSQVENNICEAEIEDLKLVSKATKEKYENMLDDAKHELDVLTSTIELSKKEFHSSKTAWEDKELDLLNSMKKLKEENSSSEKEISRLLNLLKETEEEACLVKVEESHLQDNLKEARSETIYLQEALGEAKAESMKLKESLLDRENELQSVIQENEDLKTKEEVLLKKVEDLSKLLDEICARKQTVENGEFTDSEKDYDLLPKVVEFSEENGHKREEKPKLEVQSHQNEESKMENLWEENNRDGKSEQNSSHTFENTNGNSTVNDKNEKEDDSVEVEYKMWESCKIEKKEFSPEREPDQESFEEERDSKVESSGSFDQVNGTSSTENLDDSGISPSKPQQLKKKKPLLRKFGNLLKKKSSSSQK